MGDWRVVLGNQIARGVSITPEPPSVESALYPLSNIGLGQPDTAGAFGYDDANPYEVAVDTGMLKSSSPRSDAPNGWADLLLQLAGTPGLSAFPDSIGTHFGRGGTLEAFRPEFQDFDVLSGERFTSRTGLYIDAAGGSSTTAINVILIDLKTGKRYDGGGLAWTDTGILHTSAVVDAWDDLIVSVVADPAQTERTTYRLIVENVAPSFDASSHFYVADGAASGAGASFYGFRDFVAVVGHNIPAGSLVEFENGSAGPVWVLTALQPSFFYVDATAETHRVVRLKVTPPAAALGSPIYIGELWTGEIVDMAWCPRFPADITIADSGQVRVPGGYGRQSVFSDAARGRLRIKMNFEADDAGYLQARDYLEGATRHGADPLLILPVDILEGPNAIYHARLNNEVLYSRINNQRRRYSLTAEEDPFPRL